MHSQHSQHNGSAELPYTVDQNQFGHHIGRRASHRTGDPRSRSELCLWSATVLQNNPEAIYNVHLDYYKAGANIAITASYQATHLGLQKHLGLDAEQSRQLIHASVRLAQQARDAALKEQNTNPNTIRTLLVAGSVGPYGAYLANGSEYTGEYHLSNDAMKNFHRDRIQALVDAGADLLACETMPSFDEVKSLLELMQEEFPLVKAWISCTLRDQRHLSDGTPLTQVVELVNKSDQIIALGFNCIPEQDVSSSLDHLRSLTEKPLIVYPNSGEHWDAEKRKWFGTRAEGQTLALLAKEWHRKGARFIGGCCRTTPSDVKVIYESLVSEDSN